MHIALILEVSDKPVFKHTMRNTIKKIIHWMEKGQVKKETPQMILI